MPVFPQKAHRSWLLFKEHKNEQMIMKHATNAIIYIFLIPSELNILGQFTGYFHFFSYDVLFFINSS